jgi:hypothetical protein
MTRIKLNDDLIESVTPCFPVDWKFRYDVFPFVISYSLLFSISSFPAMNVISLYAIPVVLLAQIFLFLFSQWSLLFKLRLGYKIVSDITKAQYVFVCAAKNVGRNRVEKLNTRVKRLEKELVIAGNKFEFREIYFQFQNVLYEYSNIQKTFFREIFPTNGTIFDYLNHAGHKESNSFVDSIERWGSNVFDIPIPLFLDLYLVNNFFLHMI